MAGEKFVVARENGVLSVVRERTGRTSDGRKYTEKCAFNVAGNIEGLKEGDVLSTDTMDYALRRVKYTEDGRQRSKIIMLLYGWEKVEEA